MTYRVFAVVIPNLAWLRSPPKAVPIPENRISNVQGHGIRVFTTQTQLWYTHYNTVTCTRVMFSIDGHAKSESIRFFFCLPNDDRTRARPNRRPRIMGDIVLPPGSRATPPYTPRTKEQTLLVILFFDITTCVSSRGCVVDMNSL